jgi:hypothetical protein
MSPTDHNKILGICHLVYGGIHSLTMLAVVAFFIFFAPLMPPDGPPPAFFLFIGTFILFFTLLFTIPAFVAGYALLKHKSWARTACIVAAVLEAMNAPIGTAVCIYSFWFMFSDAGKKFYEQTTPYDVVPRSLAEAQQPPAWWRDEARAREAEPLRAPQPPDWRGQ